jgi:hypothetical protein
LAAGLWDSHYRFTFAELFAVGLTAVGLLLHELRLGPTNILWLTGVSLAAYLLAAATVQFVIDRGRQRADTAGSSAIELAPGLRGAWQRQERGWIVPAQVTIGGVALALSFWIVLTFSEFPDRAVAPLIVLAVTAAVTLVSRSQQRVLTAAIITGITVFLCQVGWSFIAPDVIAAGMQRLAIVLVAFVAMAECCMSLRGVWSVGRGALNVELTPHAPRATRHAPQIGVGFAAASTCAVLLLLLREAASFDIVTKHTMLLPPLVALCALAIAVLVALVVRLAVVPGLDPFELSERSRTLYVYFGELLLLGLLLHTRLNVPELFKGEMVRYWTFVIIGLAYLGVGLSEWLHRRKLHVLAWPLFNTGLVLAFVPIVVFWAVPAAFLPHLAERAPDMERTLRFAIGGENPLLRHSSHWLLVAILFTIIAAVQRRFIFAFLAALFLNFALWSFWGQLGSDFAIWLHPQIWLIPLAVILLVAEYTQRDRLSTVQAMAVRNAALLILYVSSTADMFIAGLGNSLWLPIVLALFAVAGVLAGILMRVRAFLLQGTAFLFVVVLAQIWHAAVDRQQTWVWWVSGIVLGIAIITLFAIFEKRKQDVVKLLEELKEWR